MINLIVPSLQRPPVVLFGGHTTELICTPASPAPWWELPAIMGGTLIVSVLLIVFGVWACGKYMKYLDKEEAKS